RIQVEHPITEAVTGVDLVKAQIEIAAGRPLRLRQQDVVQRGWAIECRIYAEDPENHFLPAPGKIEVLRVPSGIGVRDDSGVYEGFEVSTSYDPLLSKLVAWGSNRDEAIDRMLRALCEYTLVGPTTNLAFHRRPRARGGQPPDQHRDLLPPDRQRHGRGERGCPGRRVRGRGGRSHAPAPPPRRAGAPPAGPRRRGRGRARGPGGHARQGGRDPR